MAEISKPDFQYVWASGGATIAPSNVKIQTGWTAEVPPFQWENWSQNRQDAAISHILQKGISVWSATGEYYFTTSGERSYVQGSDGNIYVAVADSIGQNPTTDATDTYWKIAFVDYPALAAALNISGVVVGSARNVKMSIPTAAATGTLTADEIVVAVTLSGARYKLSSFSKTINLATTGAGGMDTGTAPVSGYVAIYAIYNPTTTTSALLATNATAAVQPEVYGGANMPSGYAASALVSVNPTNASSQLAIGYLLGRQWYTLPVLVGNISTQLFVHTALSVATFAPINARQVGGYSEITAGASTGPSVQVSGSAGAVGVVSATGIVNGYGQTPFSNIPVITAQTIYWAAGVLTGTFTSAKIYLSSYTF